MQTATIYWVVSNRIIYHQDALFLQVCLNEGVHDKTEMQ